MTIDYLVNAEELQIKIAQGAKPGEGGQLPGHKVDELIARLRYAHARHRADLAAAAPRHLLDRGPRAADPRPAAGQPGGARLGQAGRRGGRRHGRRGRGQGAAPTVVIAGHDGGTGAARCPRSRTPASPWELGLAETQQTLVRNGLRDARRAAGRRRPEDRPRRGRRRAAGRREFGFGTAPMIALGCIMMRVCHLNTCPVGIATQDPELRAPLRRAARAGGALLPAGGRGSARIMASLGVAPLRRPRSAAPTCCGPLARRLGRADALDLLAAAGAPARERHGAPHARASASALLDDELIAGARGAALAHGRPRRAAARGRRTPTARSARAVRRGRAPARRARPARAPIDVTLRPARPGRASAPGSPPASPFDRARRRQRLRRQGHGRRRARGPARRARAAARARTTYRRQHRAVRRDRRRAVLPRARRASASRCATRARSRWSRASATTAAST